MANTPEEAKAQRKQLEMKIAACANAKFQGDKIIQLVDAIVSADRDRKEAALEELNTDLIGPSTMQTGKLYVESIRLGKLGPLNDYARKNNLKWAEDEGNRVAELYLALQPYQN